MDNHHTEENHEEEIPESESESDMDLNLDYMISLKIYLETEYNIPPDSHSMIIRHLFTFLKEFKFTNGEIKTAITLLYENQFPDKIIEMHYVINRLLTQETFSSNLSNLFSSLTTDNNDQNDDILDRYTGNIINPANILYYFTNNVNNINPVIYNSHINNIPMFNLFTLDPSSIFNFTTQVIIEDITPLTNNGKETLDQTSLNSVSLTDTFSNLDNEIKKKFDTCPICFDDFKEDNIIRQIKCNHIFHQSCIDPWLLNESYKCPVCRESTIPEHIPNPAQNI